MDDAHKDPLGAKVLDLYERAVDIALAADADDHHAIENGIRAAGYLVDQRACSLEARSAERDDAPAEIPAALLRTDRLVLATGSGDDGVVARLLDLLREGRRAVVATYGVVPPGVVVRHDPSLDADAYRIVLDGEVAETGTATVDELARRVRAVVEANLAELLTREEVAELLNRARIDQPMVVQELVPNMLSVGQLRQVLQQLVRERIPIRNHAAILNALADEAVYTKDPTALTERVRRALGRTICVGVADADGRIRAVRLSPSIERELQHSIQLNESGQVLMLDGTTAASIRSQVVELAGSEPATVVTIGKLRRHVRSLLVRELPSVTVLSDAEVVAPYQVEVIGTVEDRSGAVAAMAVAGSATTGDSEWLLGGDDD